MLGLLMLAFVKRERPRIESFADLPRVSEAEAGRPIGERDLEPAARATHSTYSILVSAYTNCGASVPFRAIVLADDEGNTLCSSRTDVEGRFTGTIHSQPAAITVNVAGFDPRRLELEWSSSQLVMNRVLLDAEDPALLIAVVDDVLADSSSIDCILSSVTDPSARPILHTSTFLSGVSEATIQLEQGIGYRLAVRGSGLVYDHPGPVTAHPSCPSVLVVDLDSTCKVAGELADFPPDELPGMRLIVRGSSPDSPWLPAETRVEDGGEFQLRGGDPRASPVGIWAVLEDGREVRLKERGTDRTSFGLCEQAPLILAPVHPLIGICLLDPISMSPLVNRFSIYDGEDPDDRVASGQGVLLIRKEVLEGKGFITANIEDFGLRRLELVNATALSESILGFPVTAPLASGAIRVILDGGIIGSTGVELRVQLSDPNSVEAAAEPFVLRQENDVVFQGLTPAAYDVYWTWGRVGRRYIATDLHVSAGEEVRVHASPVRLQPTIGRFHAWESIPSSLRPKRVTVQENSSAVDDDGRFSVVLALPYASGPIGVVTRVSGFIENAGTAVLDPEGNEIVAELSYSDLREVSLVIDRVLSGKIRGCFTTTLSAPRIVGGVRSWLRETAIVDEEGSGLLTYVHSGEARVNAWILESTGSGSKSILRGWIDDVDLHNRKQLQLRGRWLVVDLTPLFEGATIELIARTDRLGTWAPPAVSLGDFAAGTAHEVWFSDQVSHLEALDSKGEKLRVESNGDRGYSVYDD